MENKISNTTGKWLGWIGIAFGAIAFFWQPLWMSIISIICAVVGLFSEEKTLNWIALAVGVIALIVYFV